MKKIRVAGLNFDHMHMGDLLRKCHEHPQVEIVGLCDDEPARMRAAQANFSVAPERVFTDPARCLEQTRPDFVVLCPATADHASYVERVAPYRVHMLVEKPFAASLADCPGVDAGRCCKLCLTVVWDY